MLSDVPTWQRPAAERLLKHLAKHPEDKSNGMDYAMCFQYLLKSYNTWMVDPWEAAALAKEDAFKVVKLLRQQPAS